MYSRATTWEYVEIILGNLIPDEDGYWAGIEVPHANENERVRIWTERI